MKLNKQRLILLGLILVILVVLDYLFGMTYNFENAGTIVYIGFWIIVIAGVLFIDPAHYKQFNRTFLIVAATVIGLMVIGGLSSSQFFRAKAYADVIGDVEEVQFIDLYGSNHVIEMSYVDKDSAIAAAEKRIGELSEVSSRFEIDSEEFSQINYQGKMVRVAPFQYTDTIKEYMNYSQGVPYYVIVTTGDGNTNAVAEIVKLEESMKYYPGAPLNYNLMRHVSYSNKFSYLDDWYFEIDDNGHPYWLVQAVDHKVGLWGGKSMSALVIVDAVSGEVKRYGLDEIPEWVDTVYPTDMLLNQAKDHYTLSGGFLNSVFQQRNVMAIDREEGSYNYVSIDEEIYVFTGIRPIKVDSTSTTGMLFISKRTGKAIELKLPGVSLAAAENTATGSIQEKNYATTTPVLQNVSGYPTYVMSLKDTSGVVRGFALVNYQDYTKSAVGSTLKEAQTNYGAVMGSQNDVNPIETKTISGVLESIQPVTIDGNTYYLLRLTGDSTIYQANLSINYELAFLKNGTFLTLTHAGNTVSTLTITAKAE